MLLSPAFRETVLLASRITLVTYKDLPELDPDDHLLRDALRRRGHEVLSAVWNDSDFDWSSAGTSIIRSTWDYHLHYHDFRAWLERTASLTRLLNPPELLRWNCNKQYLRELEAKGLPVIKTCFVSKFDSLDALAAVLAERDWSEFIVKPTVGLATSGVKKMRNDKQGMEEALPHLMHLLETSEAMIQEFLPSIYDYGERALVYIDGEFSHAVRKTAFQALAVAGRAGERSVPASPEEKELAGAVIKALPLCPLYARVDLVRDRSNQPVLLELELVEPSLFLQTNPQAAEALALAVERCLPS